MPKLTTRIPRYCKHKASGQAVVKFGGKLHYLGRYGSRNSKANYQRLVGEWLAADRNLPADTAEVGDLTIVELLRRYMPFARRHYRKHGQPTNELVNISYAIKPLKDLYGRTRVQDFGPLALKSLQAHLVQQALSRTTINARIGIIRRVFRWAVSEQLSPSSVLHGLASVSGLQAGRTQARETAPITPVEDSIVNATIEHLPRVVADMIRLQRLTGCRPEEICLLRPCDVEMNGPVWAYRPRSHKMEHRGRERVIFVGPKAQDVLRPYLLRDKASYCFSPADSERKRRIAQHEARKTPLSCGNRPNTQRTWKPARPAGERYSTSTYRRAIHRACALAFAPPDELDEAARAAWRTAHQWSPNRLRHSAASEIRRRFGLEAAQVTLGHAAVATTEIYAERDLAKAAAIMAQIG